MGLFGWSSSLSLLFRSERRGPFEPQLGRMRLVRLPPKRDGRFDLVHRRWPIVRLTRGVLVGPLDAAVTLLPR